MPTEMLTVDEAARRLKMNPQTVRRWIRSGLLSAHKIGGKEYRINADDLEARVTQPTPVQAAQRTANVSRLLSLRERLRGRDLSVMALLAESREELEGRNAARGR
jgi:excisionase family DNA binding protein